MIKEITLETLDDLSDVITDFLQFLKEKYGRPEFPFKEQLREQLSRNARNVFALYNQENRAIGFAMTHPEGITRIYVQNSIANTEIYEKELFNAAFNHLKSCYSVIRIWDQSISDNLGNYACKLGFQDSRRARMFIDKKTIENLAEPDIPSEYMFTAWNNDVLPSIVSLIASPHFDGSNLFAGIDQATQFFDNLKTNMYGQYSEHYTRILTNNEECLGACFLTSFPEFGYIPEIVISPSHRGKGLGKALLIHSLKQFIEKEPKFSRIELDVTIKNIPAKKTYDSLGFQEKNRYSVFIWNKD
ncbi:MAG: GNAT family N-acetyltransferase [Candidatus Hermodarchaeota archaeon]